jgi:hypothetical protein
MSFFDPISELRKREANAEKAAKVMKVLGWICVVDEVWNYVLIGQGRGFRDPASY